MKKAFTIVELLLAIALLASLLVTSGIVFRVAAKSHMTAAATAEISRKLRGITDQLNADFKGLRKDAELFVVWVPSPVDVDGNPLGMGAPAALIDRYERMDRIMFFADGDFQSYNEWPDYLVPPTRGDRIIQGTTARIAYMLTKDDIDHLDAGGNLVQGKKAEYQDAHKRILGRSQHIFTSDSTLVDRSNPPGPPIPRIRWIDPANIDGLLVPPPVLGQDDQTGAFTQANENYYEFDNLTFNEWLNLPYIPHKQEIFSVIADVIVDFDPADGIVPTEYRGMVVNVDSKPPLNVHQLLSEGVGEFSVQGWYDDPILGPRWFPQLDLTPADGVIIDENDTDYNFDTAAGRLHDSQVSGYIYNPLDDFNSVPGLGRALKFTFTLYDSRGVFENGKKFTHIVYLDE